MAKCVAPAMSAETRGRVGGIVFNTFRGKSTIKGKVAPAQPRSARQLLIRAIMTQMSRLWQLNTFQSEWNEYATTHLETDWTNSSTRLTGHNWFVRLNTILTLMGSTNITEPPATAAPDAVTGLTATGGSGTIAVAWTSPTTSGLKVDIRFEGPLTKGRQGSLPRARFDVYEDASTGTHTISNNQAGRYFVWCRTIDTATGLASTWTSAFCDVT